MRARDLMVTDVETISEDATVREAVRLMRARPLDTAHVDVRCLVVLDGAGKPIHLLTEADLVHATMPWVFRERRFSDYIGKWLSSEVPEAAVQELYEELTSRARTKTVKEILNDRPLVTVEPGASLLKLAYTLYVERIKTVPVMEDGKVVGMVYRTAVFEAVADHIEGTAKK